MEKTNDESFVSHNSSKPFIRTMEDDLQKIKDNSAGNDKAASVSTPTPLAAGIFNKEIKKADSVIKSVSAPILTSVSKPASVLIPVIPAKSAVDMSIAEKAEEERIKKDNERIAQIEAKQEIERVKKQEETLRLEREKAEQLRKEKEEFDRAKQREFLRLKKEEEDKAEKAEEERVKKDNERLAQIESEQELERSKEEEELSNLEKEKIEQVKRENIIRLEKEKAEQARREKERLAQIEAERELERARKINEELKKEKEKIEQIRKEKEAIEQANRIEEDRIRKEKEKIAQIEFEREMERAKKRKEFLRLEKEKAEQARKEREAIEQAKKEDVLRFEKEKAEQARKERERLAKVEAERELEKARKRREDLRLEREKAEQVKKDKEAIEQAKRDEEMMIKKKLSEEIKEEMKDEIEKEKEKAEKVKIEIAMEIEKELDEAKNSKRERETAMKKRVAKIVKEEMDAEIEVEKEKAEKVKAEVEMEIKKETEEEIEKEEELEKEIKEEMVVDMRKEIAEKLKVDKKEEEDKKKIEKQIKKETKKVSVDDPENGLDLPKINFSAKAAKPAVMLADALQNLSFRRISDSDDQTMGDAQAGEENIKKDQGLRNKELEISRKKEEERLAQIEAEKELRRKREKEDSLKKEIAPRVVIVPSIPKNLPVEVPFSDKENLSGVKREEKGDFIQKPQNRRILIEETENLSPEARLARQTASDIGNNRVEAEGSLAVPLAVKNSAVVSPVLSNLSGSFNSISPAQSLDSKGKTVDDIIREDNSGLKKIIQLFFVVLVVAGIGTGAYFLFIAKKPVATPAVTPVVANVPTEALVGDVADVIIFTDLNVNLSDKIKLYFSNNSSRGVYRLILKDKDGVNNLELENFSESLNITLPNPIINGLEKDYNLIAFNYPEENYLRLGLVFKIKDAFNISAFSGEWESDMYRNIETIFLDDPGVYEGGRQFGSNSYNNFSIRYLPLGVDNISLNYAFDNENKFLLIATSKQDIIYLIDKTIKGN